MARTAAQQFAYEEGMLARVSGRDRRSCPYLGSHLADQWFEGYENVTEVYSA